MKNKLLIFFILTVLGLTSCNTSKSIHLKDSSDSKKDSFSSLKKAEKIEEASIVHIDQKQRILTIRSERPLDKGYYITSSQLNEQESAVIKLYDASYQSIFIADILEGSPKIGDSIYPATEERSKELDKNYAEAIID